MSLKRETHRPELIPCLVAILHQKLALHRCQFAQVSLQFCRFIRAYVLLYCFLYQLFSSFL